MFIHARIDNSFINAEHDGEQERLSNWLDGVGDRLVVLLELGAGYNIPGVIRFRMERLPASLLNSSLIRVNSEHAQTPTTLRRGAISVLGDIGSFLQAVEL